MNDGSAMASAAPERNLRTMRVAKFFEAALEEGRKKVIRSRSRRGFHGSLSLTEQ